MKKIIRLLLRIFRRPDPGRWIEDCDDEYRSGKRISVNFSPAGTTIIDAKGKEFQCAYRDVDRRIGRDDPEPENEEK
jgi:hypothetical protein